MEKFNKIIDNTKIVAYHDYTNLDDAGRVELCWIIKEQGGCCVTIFLKRFEVFIPDVEDDNLNVIIPLSGYYQNKYVLSADAESADKAIEAAHGLITAMLQTTYAALR